MLAVTSYQVALTVHILAAVIWVGGALMLQILSVLALRSSLPGRTAEFAGEAEVVGTRLFLPTSLILLGLGFYLVHSGHWGYHLWVWLALMGFAFSFLTGFGFLAPESKRIKNLLETQGPESSEAKDRIKRILMISRVEAVILILIVVDMVLKPGQ